MNTEQQIDRIVNLLMDDYAQGRVIDANKQFAYPDKDIVIDILEKLKVVIYPGYYRNSNYRTYTVRNNISILLEDIIYHLQKQTAIVLRYTPAFENSSAAEISAEAERVTFAFLETIPKIREYIETDIQAFYDGDPAAYNKDEIICTYPGLYAISTARIAHELFLLGVPLIPRVMTEHAHSLTGIDIHPGTTIGKYFFIDHGTGIVIGETTEIGNHVKVYQGVTLGALSTRGGQNLRGKKRHPTIRDNVTIYSGASILGGDTVIGEGVVVGGNAFITTSIPDGAKVNVKSQELMFRYEQGKQPACKEVDPEKKWFPMI